MRRESELPLREGVSGPNVLRAPMTVALCLIECDLSCNDLPDIPHCLLHCCDYSAVESFIRLSQEFEQR